MTLLHEDRQATGMVVAGVDTHQLAHHAVVLDRHGGRAGQAPFPATEAGYGQLLDWAGGFGPLAAIGVESTGSYGAGLTRYLRAAGVTVHEINRPDKTTRARRGKSDPIDAESAARQVLAGHARALPKDTTGAVEALRMVKTPRDGAVRDRTRAANQLRDLITTAPSSIHEELIELSTAARVRRAAGYRPDPRRVHDPAQAAKLALRTLAQRIQRLTTEINTADKIIDQLTRELAPRLRAMPQFGPQTTAQLVITLGENPERVTTEARFAKLCGVAPLPASSGKSRRHRLNRGGDRAANSALHMIVVGRLRNHEPTQTYAARRETEGLSRRETIRCLKRHLARTVYKALIRDLTTT